MDLRNALPVRATRQVFLLLATVAIFLVFYTTFALPKPSAAQLSGRFGKVDAAPQQTVFEVDGVAFGKPFHVPANSSGEFDSISWLIDSLKSRYLSSSQESGYPVPEYPTCELNPVRYAGTRQVPSKKVTSSASGEKRSMPIVAIAVNLFNSGAIIPAQTVALVEAIAYLLTSNRVLISVFENDSSDNTRELFADFVAALQLLGVDGLWIESSHLRSPHEVDRIVLLSEHRNRALSPLLRYIDGEEATLLFLNDVVTCASDVLELVHQQRLQKADMAIGMDWGLVSRDDPLGKHEPRLYDMWVARGINGQLFYPFEKNSGYHPVSPNDDWMLDAFSTQSEDIHRRWLDGRPFPIYSGWGGMAAFDASLFTREHLRFRSSIASGWEGGSSSGALGTWGQLVSSEEYLEGDCRGASECEYICRDIWNLRRGRARIVLAPQARTAYDIGDWEAVLDQVPAVRRLEADIGGGDIVQWHNISVPETVECIASRTAAGLEMEPWEEWNERIKLKPIYNTGQEAT